jgi:hypothetical protein
MSFLGITGNPTQTSEAKEVAAAFRDFPLRAPSTQGENRMVLLPQVALIAKRRYQCVAWWEKCCANVMAEEENHAQRPTSSSAAMVIFLNRVIRFDR